MYRSLHDKLNVGKEVDKCKRLVMARLSNFPCPVNLDKRPSRLHIHPSNGVFVAVDGDVLYCSCSECSFEEDRNIQAGRSNTCKGN